MMNWKRVRMTGVLVLALCLVGLSGSAQAGTFPPAGQDVFVGKLFHNAWINVLGQELEGEFFGTTTVDRSNPVPDITGGGDERVDTVMTSMNMTGTVGIFDATLSLQIGTPTVGEILDTNPNPADSFPAESFFDVFFEIDVLAVGMTLHNNVPLRMVSVIDSIPPDLEGQPYYWDGNSDPLANEVQLFDASEVYQGYVTYGKHPEPASVVLLVAGGLVIGGWTLIRRRRRSE